jgi:hypothetical protein
VVGHVTSALDLEDRHVRRREQVFPTRTAAQGEYMRVFHQQQGVRHLVALASG